MMHVFEARKLTNFDQVSCFNILSVCANNSAVAEAERGAILPHLYTGGFLWASSSFAITSPDKCLADWRGVVLTHTDSPLDTQFLYWDGEQLFAIDE
jgi:hypothetical protein